MAPFQVAWPGWARFPGLKPWALYTICRREAGAQRNYGLSGKASLAGANKIQAGSLCYFTPSRGCRGFADCARMFSRDLSTLRKAM
jgi:hypothetical protein